MAVNPAPINENPTQPMPSSWALWFNSVYLALKYSGRSYPVASLPAASIGAVTIASNGRKAGEGAGSGTGCPVWWDGTIWRTFYDNSQVAA
jgi:hypothetical protein